MPSETFSDLIAPALVAVVTAIGTYFSTLYLERRRHRRDFATRAAESIRADRLKAYKGLWQALEPMSQDWTAARDLGAVHGELRSWYYREGGMLLSREALLSFWGLQELLKAGKGHDEAYPQFVKLAKAIRNDLWTESVPPAPGIDQATPSAQATTGGS